MLRLTLLLALMLLGGCSAVYPHSESNELLFTAARTNLDTTGIPEVFEREAEYLARLRAEETAAITARDIAVRDRDVLDFLNGTADMDGIFKKVLETRIAHFYGDDNSTPAVWETIESQAAAARSTTEMISANEDVVKDYRQDGGTRATDCAAVRESALAAAPENESAAQARRYKIIRRYCESLGDVWQTKLKPKPVKDAGLWHFQTLTARLKAEEDSLSSKRREAAERVKRLGEGQKELAASFSKAPVAREAIDKLLGEIASARKLISNPYIRHALATYALENVDLVVSASEQAPAASPPPPAHPRTLAAISMLQAMGDLSDAYAVPARIPHPNVIAIFQAQATYQRDIAAAEIAQIEKEVLTLRRQLSAVTTAVYFLSRANSDLKALSTRLPKGQGIAELLAQPKTRPAEYRHAVSALMNYTSAWNYGLLRLHQLEVERSIDQRFANLGRSTRSAHAWVETLRPGLNVLATYAEGGIGPQTFAQLLGSLGLVATGVGVNK